MVSTKLSLAVATTALLQFASARQCTASLQDTTSGGTGGGIRHNQRIWVSFNDNPDDHLDEQTDAVTDVKHMNIYDGVQTLSSDALGGDVRLWATKEEGAVGANRGIG